MIMNYKPCEDIRIRNHGQLRRRGLRDAECASPFGKMAAVSLILNTSFLQIVQTFRSIFGFRAKKRDQSLVDLNTGHDIPLT